ncbi:hypothetical protein FB451DRAFT_1464943 [Mycena latifolia]|nr:hypothetical protein FB451DRAFT_1464943 [Mycena latifolia]
MPYPIRDEPKRSIVSPRQTLQHIRRSYYERRGVKISFIATVRIRTHGFEIKVGDAAKLAQTERRLPASLSFTLIATPAMFLDILRNQLSDLGISISQHERLLQELKEQRAAVQLQLDRFVYPILTLPPEITSEIFLWCSEPTRGVMYPSVAPLLILQVCRAWRAIAVSTPALWDTIRTTESDNPKNMENAIKSWFGRAGSHPLSLDFTYSGRRDSMHLHSLICRYASRLQSLELCSEGDFSDLTDIRPFPLLRHLTLISIGGTLDSNGTPIPPFGSAPLLCHLEIHNLPPSRLMIPWSQLTNFTATLVALEECLGVLRLATALEEFHRSCCPGAEEGSVIGSSLMCHSDLTSLTVDAGDYYVDYDILQSLILPRLEKLQVGGRFGEWTDLLNTVVLPFLHRISSTLRTFTVGLSPAVPTEWFHITTHLTTLELVGPQYATEVIHALDRRNAPDFLPRLQNLAYSECAPDQVDINLVNALNSRCADAAADTDTSCARLESFRLIWPEDEPAGTLPLAHVASLRALASQGMHIHIGTRNNNTFN